ncbi:LOW QUALITY PROTEIN: Hsp70 family protein [Aspergillus fumigatus Af293]|uniref:Hsp70 family chaperone n=1 Tax=Aspergillus fumigatus (strain ATCC MYA-4609 / CBS 101355 / FGSC A1100 / Af293) TaxID=330879 RepID=A4D9X7_ASPFU|nr:LOW QUALITY PROTEIN: conserved hypothetical protein [Aspergillus fumigatus Af293]EBA27283.1 conserved hypothetical protein [Aspergillus fumigatus Af293]
MDGKEVVAVHKPWDDDWGPDIVVGVDFGMTCTGVAYSIGPEWLPPRTIQRWPGKLISELANKVPTAIEYESPSHSVKSWGFLCNTEDPASDIKEYFKLHLAPGAHQGGKITRAEAQRWLQDYIRCVCQHVTAHFRDTLPSFAACKVEWVFSVPTTWKDVRMVEETRHLLQRAINMSSPGMSPENNRAVVGLTEAEAAAVYACRQHYQMNDIVLVCDAGGGTTDVNILQLKSARGEPTKLDQFGSVEGRPIGSVFIDRGMHSLICGRLSKLHDRLEMSPSHTAWRMVLGRFQRLKCAFGTPAAANTPSLKLDVPGLKPGADVPGQMSISWDDLQQCFDAKIAEMFDLLDGQIRHMHDRFATERISCLILSGGFGSSPYVRKRLMERYGSEIGNGHGNTTAMRILMAEEPQLAAVHGLVLDRIQLLKQGVLTFGSRCSPVSYGIICDQLYIPEKHAGELIRQDPHDQLSYAIDQIDWLVVQGSPVPPTGFSKEFQLKLEPGREVETFQVHIVMSHYPPALLPKSMSHKGVERVCTLHISTEGVDKKLKNRHWYNRKPVFWKGTFSVKVVVGPADLAFQLWSKDQRIRSSSHPPIALKWMSAGV